MSDVIPLFRPSCGDEEIEAVTRVLRSGWWGMGPETEKFEEEFAAYTGARHAVAVSSGTMALELAAKATGLVNGCVIVPALTFVSTAQAMQHAGNEVFFADIREDTLCLDWIRVSEWLQGRHMMQEPVGVVPVWYAGAVDSLIRHSKPGITREQDGITIIEDCAHAAGSFLAGRLGDASAWSFHAVKNLATGDGGMVTTNDEAVAREVRRMRWCGIDRSTWDRDKDSRVGYGWDYDIPGDGEKAHMNDITAALGRVQLSFLDKHNSLRRWFACHYNDQFGSLGWLRTPAVSANDSMHLYAVRVPAVDRDRFIRHCITEGVSAGVHYKPLTHYSQFNATGQPEPEYDLTPVTNRVWKTLVTLPLYPGLSMHDAEKVIRTVKAFHPSKGAEL